jgi:hypothetical protein
LTPFTFTIHTGLTKNGSDIDEANCSRRVLGRRIEKGFLGKPGDLFCGGVVKANATAIAGPEVTYTDELDNIVKDFYKAFEKNLLTD